MVNESILSDEVWNQEVAYWEYLRTDDLESFLSLWHDDVVGWPNNYGEPTDKAGIHQLMSGLVDAIQLESITFDLRPNAVRIFGDIGIVHYEVHIQGFLKAGSDIAVDERITHTSLNTENGWKIISGMSAPLTYA